MSDRKDPFADLRALLVEPVVETVAGRELIVQPFAFERVAHVVELVDRVRGMIKLDVLALDFDLLGLLTQQYDTAVDLIATLANVPEDWARALAIDQAMFVLGIFVRVNADFFLQRLAPLVMLTLSSLERSASPSPQTPSAPTGTPAQAGPPSSTV